MIEVVAIILFSKKLKLIAKEKNLESKKWIIQLILTWISVEIGAVIIGMMILGESRIIEIAVLALILAIFSGFYTVNKLKNKINSLSEMDILEKNKDKFKHFR